MKTNKYKKGYTNIMPANKLLEALAETLSNIIHKEYVESYISDGERGLSAN